MMTKAPSYTKILTISLLAIATMQTIGCTGVKTGWLGYTRLNTNAGGALVAIDQRAIISHLKTDANGQNPYAIVCAEPSPDGMTALSLSASGKSEKADLVAAFSAQENASYVGLRSQSIQLLRDAMYRACEGYLSGGLTKAAYDISMRRYQKNMVVIVIVQKCCFIEKLKGSGWPL